VGRPIVNIDSPIDAVDARHAGLDIRTYIGTNDFEAGRVAGTGMVALLHGTGEIAFVTGPPRNVNSDLRVSGFARAIQHTDLRVAARVSAEYERTKAQLVAGQLLRTHPRIRGFFAVNDLMALGIADALSAAGRSGQVKVIGVDGIPEALDAVRAGAITATVSQYPYVMGQMAIEACAAVTHGAELPRRVDAPIQLVTTQNAGRAVAAFPRPIEPYADPFKRLVGRRP
jgi:ribose transport system substrate-binding protein